MSMLITLSAGTKSVELVSPSSSRSIAFPSVIAREKSDRIA